MAAKPSVSDINGAGEALEPVKKDASDDEILREARDRFTDVSGRDRENRASAKEDTEFVYIAGKQWDSKVKERWGDDPTLEFPQLKQFVNQVVNDQRQNRPGVQVHPAGGDASKETAEVIQGMVRHIEYDSQAEAIYDNGFQAAVVGGRGYWRICSEYEKPTSFNQKLRLKPIEDPLTVYADPDFSEPDGSDRAYVFVTETLTAEDFKAKYPKASPISWDPDSQQTNWYTPDKKQVVVADYYRRVCTKRTLVQLTDGSSVWDDELPEGAQIATDEKGEPLSRESEDYTVEWYTIAGGEQVLEEYDWPGTIIPVVCCMGDTIMIDGKRIFQGLVRQARDAQKMYNYEKSMKAIMLGQAPIAPWVASEEAIQGYEGIWKNANKGRYGVLPFRSKDESGNPIPPPQRTQFAPVPTGWAEAAQSDKDDIKSIIGMYQNSLGQHGAETSGRAILAREKQGDNSTFHFVDNMSRAIALTGRIIVEVLGDYYDTQRLVGVINKDDSRALQSVNQPQMMQAPDGSIQAIIEHDLTTGEYAVTVEAGPSYATAREQTRESLMALVQSDPAIMQIAGDIIVGAMDFPDADELAERLKLMLPPPIQQHLAQKAQEDGGQAAAQQQVTQLMQQVQQGQMQAQQMQQAMQQLQQENMQLKSGVAAKVQIGQMETQAHMEQAQQEAQIARQKALLDAQTKLEVAKIGAETQVLIAGLSTPKELSASGAPVPAEGGGQPRQPAPAAGPDPGQQAAIAQLATHVAQLHKKVSGKKRHKFEYDEAGNIIGATSEPAEQQSQ